jgi:hypothetical protein
VKSRENRANARDGSDCSNVSFSAKAKSFRVATYKKQGAGPGNRNPASSYGNSVKFTVTTVSTSKGSPFSSDGWLQGGHDERGSGKASGY